MPKHSMRWRHGNEECRGSNLAPFDRQSAGAGCCHSNCGPQHGGMGCTTDQESPTSHYRRHRSYRALAAERRDGAPARMRGNAMIVTFTPAEFRDRSAAWDRRAKEATSAEDHKMMLYAAA